MPEQEPPSAMESEDVPPSSTEIIQETDERRDKIAKILAASSIEIIKSRCTTDKILHDLGIEPPPEQPTTPLA